MSSMDESESHSYIQSYVLVITDRISAPYPICTIFTSEISVYFGTNRLYLLIHDSQNQILSHRYEKHVVFLLQVPTDCSILS